MSIKDIVRRLFLLWKKARLDELTLDCIINSMKQILNKVADKYQKVVKEGEEAMGGEILDYPAKTARQEGIKVFILDKIEDGVPEFKIVEKLKKYYQLDDKQAQRYLQECNLFFVGDTEHIINAYTI